MWKLPTKLTHLKNLLIELYSEFLKGKFKFDERDYEEERYFDYNEIKENVKSNLSINTLTRIADTLETDVFYLLSWNERD